MTYRPEWEEPRGGFHFRPPKPGWSASTLIIVICIAVFFITAISARSGSRLLESWLVLRLDNAMFVYPFISYMFVHSTSDLLHLIVNCLMLWFFGTQVERHLGRRNFLALYFSCGIVGGLAHLLVQSLFFAVPSWLLGASGGALGIVAYAAWQWPNNQVVFFIFPMRLRMLFYILLAMDVMPVVLGGFEASRVAHFCHLGGALVGYLFWKLRLDPSASIDHWQERRAQAEQTRVHQRRVDDDREMDRILEKISNEGIGSLDRTERRFLDERSKSLREGRGR